jgi:hypothetical protein
MNELLDIKDIAGYTREYLEWKKISLDIKRRYHLISMLISIQRYPLISIASSSWLAREESALISPRWGTTQALARGKQQETAQCHDNAVRGNGAH